MPALGERLLRGQTRNLEAGIPQYFDRHAAAECGGADCAVDGYDAGRLAQDLAGDPALEGDYAVANAGLPRQPARQPAPIDQPIVERVPNDDEAAWTAAAHEGG